MRALCGVAVHAWRLSSHAGVKQAFDLKYPPVDNKATSGVYHCIVGTNFACSVTHETHFSCYLTCDNVGLAWSRAALPPGSATARQLGLLGRVRRVVRCLAHSGAEPWPTQSPQGSRDSHPCAPLRRIALRRIAWLSAARRTRHDPLECPGPHAWRLRCGLCGAAEAADLIAPLPLIPTTQVSLLIYKSKDSPFD